MCPFSRAIFGLVSYENINFKIYRCLFMKLRVWGEVGEDLDSNLKTNKSLQTVQLSKWHLRYCYLQTLLYLLLFKRISFEKFWIVFGSPEGAAFFQLFLPRFSVNLVSSRWLHRELFAIHLLVDYFLAKEVIVPFARLDHSFWLLITKKKPTIILIVNSNL